MPSDIGADGVLATDRLGPEDGSRPVVLLHGFAQNRRCWGPLATGLATGRRVVAVDLPGHGGSAAHADADLERTVDLLEATLAEPGPVDVVGYSMGGRVALTWLGAHPGRIGRLVTIGATAGIEDAAARAQRHQLDEQRALDLERNGVAEFLEEWLRLPMFAGLAEWARFDEERRTNTAAGLAGSLRRAGTGAMQPVWAALTELGRSGAAPPTLALAGERDPVFVTHAGRIAAALGGAAEVVPGAGHAAHLEQPELVTATVADFLAPG